MKLSVVMPIGRIDQFLIQTLQSVEQQTFRDFELIMVCDSTICDSLHSLLGSEEFTFSYRILQTRLQGVAFAANLGIASCCSQFIARWDSDDLCTPNRFQRQIDTFESNPEVSVIGSRVQIIDDNNTLVDLQKFKYFPDDKSIRFALKYRQPLLHSSLMFRSEILFKNRGYLYGHASEDHELFIRIARDKDVAFVNLSDVTTYYRRHSSQLSDVSSLHRHFHEIAGFMFSEFLRTGHPLYIIGIGVNIPLLRKFRYFYRSFLSKLKVLFGRC